MHLSFFRLAVRAAQSSTQPMRVGAVLARKSRVLSVGCNSRRTHPKSTVPTYQSTHAEHAACRGVDPDELRGATLYVARITKTGKWSMSRPCQSCARLLRAKGIRRVFYTNEDRGYSEERFI
jgi:deoxycytidylate deaminase